MFKKAKSVVFALKQYGLRKCVFNVFSLLVSDVCVVSFQRSGRTWLRTMIARLLSLKYGIKKMKLDTQLMTLFKPTPNIWFTHAGCTRNNNPLNFGRMLKKKKIIFLVRDPRDEIVSLYHDHTKRNFWFRGSISDFIRSEWGLQKVLTFMNYWAEIMKLREKDFLLIRYEYVRANTRKELGRILDFLKIKVSYQVIDEVVGFGSFENMRKMELSGKFNDWRISPINIKDANSYKTRKGKVGGYKEELSKEDINYINEEVKKKLNPLFGY